MIEKLRLKERKHRPPLTDIRAYRKRYPINPRPGEGIAGPLVKDFTPGGEILSAVFGASRRRP